MTIKEALTFDDVLLIPQYSEVLPSDVDVTTNLSSSLNFNIPILSAAMDTVTEDAMAIALSKAGGLGIIHKNMAPQQQAVLIQKVKDEGCQVGAALGIGDDAQIRAHLLIKAGVDVLVIDTAHGHTRLVIDAIKTLKQSFPDCPIIAGNIATGKAAHALADAGVDAVKVGIGPGSICITRIVAGIGIPQLTAIQDVALALAGSKVKIIADGGIKHSGDITKALAAGAHCVMLGSLLAGCDEAPGDIIIVDDKRYKSYRGMGSIGALRQGSTDRYFQHKSQGKPITEGVEGTVPYKGPVEDILHQLVGGLRLGMGYLGAATIRELQAHAEFVKITPAGGKESHIHNIASVQDTPNYQRVK